MGVKKNPDTGEVIEEPTRRLDDSSAGGPRTSPPGRAPGENPSALDAPTRVVSEEQTLGRTEAEEPTRLHRPGARAADAEAAKPVAASADDAMEDPVVGWLVVLAGPGKGQVCKLGYGANSLGRGEKSRVRLDFGDERISRENHATLAYDAHGRKYYLQHGGGMNLTYLGDAPVLTPISIDPMQDIRIGETTLRFVPFCGPDFDWQDLQDP